VTAGELVLDGYAELTPVTARERWALPLALRYAATANGAWLRARGWPQATGYFSLATAVVAHPAG
jgi:hypothetical protein